MLDDNELEKLAEQIDKRLSQGPDVPARAACEYLVRRIEAVAGLLERENTAIGVTTFGRLIQLQNDCKAALVQDALVTSDVDSLSERLFELQMDDLAIFEAYRVQMDLEALEVYSVKLDDLRRMEGVAPLPQNELSLKEWLETETSALRIALTERGVIAPR